MIPFLGFIVALVRNATEHTATIRCRECNEPRGWRKYEMKAEGGRIDVLLYGELCCIGKVSVVAS